MSKHKSIESKVIAAIKRLRPDQINQMSVADAAAINRQRRNISSAGGLTDRAPLRLVTILEVK